MNEVLSNPDPLALAGRGGLDVNGNLCFDCADANQPGAADRNGDLDLCEGLCLHEEDPRQRHLLGCRRSSSDEQEPADPGHDASADARDALERAGCGCPGRQQSVYIRILLRSSDAW